MTEASSESDSTSSVTNSSVIIGRSLGGTWRSRGIRKPLGIEGLDLASTKPFTTKERSLNPKDRDLGFEPNHSLFSSR